MKADIPSDKFFEKTVSRLRMLSTRRQLTECHTFIPQVEDPLAPIAKGWFSMIPGLPDVRGL